MKLESQHLKLRHATLSIPFSVLGILTAIRALELLNVTIFPTIYRLTSPQSFFVFLTGSFLTDDIFIVATAIVACVALFGIRNPLLYVIALPLASLVIFSALSENYGLADASALAALPSVIAAFFFSRRRGLHYSRIIARNSLILSTILVLLSIEVVSILTWFFYPIFSSRIYSEWQWYGADLESKLFYAFGLLSTGFMAILIFSFGLRPAMGSLQQWKNSMDKQMRTRVIERVSEVAVTRRTTMVILIASCVTVTVLSVYPYLPTINSDFQVVSVDAPFYVNQINLIKESGIFAENGPFDRNVDRAFSLLIFYGIVTVVNQPAEYVVPLLPIPLGISLVLSVFFLTRYAVKNIPLAAPIAAAITALSTQFVVGVYAGFFSNMLALSLLFLTALFFLKYHNGDRKWLNLGLFSLTLFLTLLIHVYTWVFLTSTLLLGTALFVMSTKDAARWQELKSSIPTVIIIVSTIVAVLVIASATDISGVSHLSGLLSSSVSSDFFAERWFNMNYTFRLYLGGFLTNSALIILALVWALREKPSSRFNAILLSSMFITSFFFFFGDSVVQSRMFYNIPLQVPAGIVLANIISGSLLGSLRSPARFLLVSLIILHFANYAFRSISNLYLL